MEVYIYGVLYDYAAYRLSCEWCRHTRPREVYMVEWFYDRAAEENYPEQRRHEDLHCFVVF